MDDRKGYIGGSDIAAILGLSRWKTPLQVWAEKTGNIIPEDISGKLHIRLGNKLEQTVCDLFEEETGKKVEKRDEPLIHPKHDFIRGRIDRAVVGERAILEAKTTSPWNARAWEGEEIPQEYILQTMFYMELAGSDRGYIACLVGNQNFHVRTIERDEKMQKEMIQKAVEFWKNYIEPKVMPTMITSRDADTIYNLYPLAEQGDPIKLDDTANALIDTLMAQKEDSASLTAQIEKTQNEIRALLCDNAEGITDRFRITWKNQATNRVNLTRLKAEKPDICAAYLEKSDSRVLRIKEIKEGKK